MRLSFINRETVTRRFLTEAGEEVELDDTFFTKNTIQDRQMMIYAVMENAITEAGLSKYREVIHNLFIKLERDPIAVLRLLAANKFPVRFTTSNKVFVKVYPGISEIDPMILSHMLRND